MFANRASAMLRESKKGSLGNREINISLPKLHRSLNLAFSFATNGSDYLLYCKKKMKGRGIVNSLINPTRIPAEFVKTWPVWSHPFLKKYTRNNKGSQRRKKVKKRIRSRRLSHSSIGLWSANSR